MSNAYGNWEEFCPREEFCPLEDCCRRPAPRPCPRPRPCHEPRPCCESRPCREPRPCCQEEENLFTCCRPRPCCCNTCHPCPCEKDCENLYVSPDRIECDCGCNCGCDSLASELRRLIGKKVFICLERKRGTVCILGVDSKCVKALVVGCGKIIYINIDSIVSFKEIC
nr:hypothetical protein [uncultured Niameybacter sp.]